MLALLELIIIEIMIFQEEKPLFIREGKEFICSVRASALSLLECLISYHPDDGTSGKICTGSSFTNHYRK